MPAGIPFENLYPDGAQAASTSSSAADAQLNTQYPGMPAGASPVTFDLALTAATTAAGTAIWSPPSNKRFVLASAFISSDTAGRIALCDGADIAGSRPVVQRIGANGGSSPNLVPVPYPSAAPGQALVVVSNIAGNVDIRVSGWLAD